MLVPFRSGLIFVLSFQFVAAHDAAAASPPWIAEGANAMVAADSRQASQAGLEVLRAGGNAVDAAAAVSFALGVTRPYSTGLGGGGFMIIRLADGRVTVLDYREVAPAAARAEMFVEARGKEGAFKHPSRNGFLAAGVPGVLAGHAKAVAEFGTKPLADLLAPAIRLAREGVEHDDSDSRAMEEALKDYADEPALREVCWFVWDRYLGAGEPAQLRGRWVQPELARLMEAVARNGPGAFYEGEVAEAIAKASQQGGGLFTKADLAAYRVKVRQPLRGTYRGHDIITMPPPSSGGVALIETLNILERFPLGDIARKEPAAALHLQVEAMKHAFADRARHLGDADFCRVPVERLTSRAYAEGLAKQLSPHKTLAIDAYGVRQLPAGSGTSHYCVVDRWGNIVVATETINTSFGSLAAVPEWGLVLNNEMDDFTAEPGKPNAFGLIQSDCNAVAPGKKPLSSMTPTIVLKDGQPVLMLGASGGPRIITSVLGVLVGVLDEDLPLDQAMERSRPHHQWQPDLVTFDLGGRSAAELEALRTLGHRVEVRKEMGIVQAIRRTPGGWQGASDPRKGGRPAGY